MITFILFDPEMNIILESAHQIASESTKLMHETEFGSQLKIYQSSFGWPLFSFFNVVLVAFAYRCIFTCWLWIWHPKIKFLIIFAHIGQLKFTNRAQNFTFSVEFCQNSQNSIILESAIPIGPKFYFLDPHGNITNKSWTYGHVNVSCIHCRRLSAWTAAHCYY